MNDENLKRTVLYDEHVAAKARIVPFAGFSMPVQYSGLVEEHRMVRASAGLFDVSHMGQLRLRGKDALSFVQWLTPNNLEQIIDGQAQYSLLCKSDGTIIDDIIVYRYARDHIFICVNASNIDKDFRWIREKLQERKCDCALTNESAAFALLALQGPRAPEILQKLTKTDLTAIKGFHFREGEVSGVPAILSRTGYTGEDGFEIYLPTDGAVKVWRNILQKSGESRVLPIGLGARDTLRLEMKYPLYGQDLDEKHTAIEAGLSWVVKETKGDFIGREVLARQKKEGVALKWIGFRMQERSVPRHDYDIFSGDKHLGKVSSGTHGPSLDYGIGCAYVPIAFSKEGSAFSIDIRGKRFQADVVKTPFYHKERKK